MIKIRSAFIHAIACTILTLGISGCGLLDVSDPTVVEEEDISNPSGAKLLRTHAILETYRAFASGVRYSALVSDELYGISRSSFIAAGNLSQDHRVNLRDFESWVNLNSLLYDSNLMPTRINASHALSWYRDYGTPAQNSQVAQVFALRGLTTISMAEQICEGFALHDVKNGKPHFGPPLTTEEVFESALADLDSALIYVGDSTQIRSFADVLRARTLLGLGHFADAADAVASVPTNFVWETDGFRSGTIYNNFLGSLWSRGVSPAGDNLSVSDREGGNGLDYISSNDPRIRVTILGVVHDDSIPVYRSDKYLAPEDPFVIASGIEARLIEAEAALHTGSANWLTILNDLRTDQEVTPAGLAPLVDPGTDNARIDLLFRERAFWLFLTGHRLGDMRRLMTQYGRSADQVFPIGEHPISGYYGSGTSVPFEPVREDYANTGVTGCLAW